MNTFAVEFKNKDTNINVLSKLLWKSKKLCRAWSRSTQESLSTGSPRIY